MIWKYMLRKVVYVAAATGSGALASYLTGHPDVVDWTIKGAGIAVGTAVWGAILSGVLGGGLARK